MLQKENTDTYIFPRASCGSDPRITFLTSIFYPNIERNYLCCPYCPPLDFPAFETLCFLVRHVLFICAVVCEHTYEHAHIMLTHRGLN